MKAKGRERRRGIEGSTEVVGGERNWGRERRIVLGGEKRAAIEAVAQGYHCPNLPTWI